MVFRRSFCNLVFSFSVENEKNGREIEILTVKPIVNRKTTTTMTTSYPVSMDAAAGSAMTLLFARYLTGQISENAWNKLMGFMDSGRLTKAEREALIASVNKALSEKKGESDRNEWQQNMMGIAA